MAPMQEFGRPALAKKARYLTQVGKLSWGGKRRENDTGIQETPQVQTRKGNVPVQRQGLGMGNIDNSTERQVLVSDEKADVLMAIRQLLDRESEQKVPAWRVRIEDEQLQTT
jgi:hypothetical protein